MEPIATVFRQIVPRLFSAGWAVGLYLFWGLPLARAGPGRAVGDLFGPKEPSFFDHMRQSRTETMAMIGSLALVTVLVFLLAWLVHRRRRRRKKRRRIHVHDAQATAPQHSSAARHRGAFFRLRAHHRRRRHAHRPRRPTLAQTGGLPPLREQNPTQPMP